MFSDLVPTLCFRKFYPLLLFLCVCVPSFLAFSSFPLSLPPSPSSPTLCFLLCGQGAQSPELTGRNVVPFTTGLKCRDQLLVSTEAHLSQDIPV